MNAHHKQLALRSRKGTVMWFFLSKEERDVKAKAKMSAEEIFGIKAVDSQDMREQALQCKEELLAFGAECVTKGYGAPVPVLIKAAKRIDKLVAEFNRKALS